MLLKRKIYLTLILLGFFLCQGYAQTELIDETIINRYASIQTIFAWENNNADSVLLDDASDFFEGDTVMIYCVQGAKIELTDDFGEEDIGRDAQDPRNTGKYAFLLINEIVGNTIVFNTTITPEIGPMGPGEVAQLIKVRSYHRAIVPSAGLTAPDWNGSTGGVVVMFVSTALELNGDINVSGSGFRGAMASTPYYNGDCSSSDLTLYDSSFYQIDNNRAGLKGEGTTDTRFDLMRGKSRNINGGGGGNALFSGGGGGSNFSAGGLGGNESDQCIPGVDARGIGGFDLGRTNTYYLNNDGLNRQNRIFFGGGGGTGTVMSGRVTTSGASGGGLAIIVADTIIGNGNWIIADGDNVSNNATGAGGGAGGGGCIILDVSGYKEGLLLSAVGGNGGNTNHATDATGPGGGGGGGIYWLAGSSEPGVIPDLTSVGESGENLTSTSKYGAANGSPPERKDGLEAPLRGFLFNSVPSEFWVCSDQVPDPIIASEPKGGSGSYTYTWVDSSSTQNQWQLIPGATGRSLTFSAPLSDTTYFRRIVKEDPAILPADTSFRIAVYVHQAITNNTIAAPDTVCQGEIPIPFVEDGELGNGDGEYDYQWQNDEGIGIFVDVDGATQPGYAPPGLDVTTIFRRVVTSGACVDTVAILKVEVFEPISGNVIADYDTICWNTVPDLITQDADFTLGGGDPDPTNWRYRWESSAVETGPWTEIAGETTPSYQPDVLTATTWYRREVLSGNDNACRDTSSAVEILNVQVITGNEIETADQTVCTDDLPQLMQGTTPGGGHQSQYAYLWESRTETTSWVSADNTNGNNLRNYMPPVMTGDTTEYRRIVMSGGQEGVCKDTSLSKTINVLPAIDNNTISTTVTVNCQLDNLSILNGTVPGGGATVGDVDNTRNYRWEAATGTGVPGLFGEISYGPDELDYTDMPGLSLSDDYWYRRIVFSGPSLGGQAQVCTSTSDTIHIVIHTAISNNEIDPADSVCFNTEKVLNGELPVGDPDETILYSWRDIGTGTELGDGQNLPYTFTTLESQDFNRIVVIGECEDTSNTMPITVMELPGGILSGDLPKACEKDVLLDVDLTIEGLSNYVLPWEISLDDGVNPELSDPQDLSADGPVTVSLITGAESTQYNYTIGKILYRLSDGTECLAPEANMTGNVLIEVFPTPEPKITVNTPLTDNAVCDSEVSLFVVDPDRVTGSWGSDNPDKLSFLDDPQDLDVIASIDPSDSESWDHLPYLIFFKSEAGDCSGSDTVEISFYEQPDDAYAGPADTIYFTNSVRLNAEPPTAGVGTWTPDGSPYEYEDQHDPRTMVYSLPEGENTFTWTIENGVCLTRDDYTIITQDEAQPYEGFSPNGDMLNDYFIIRGLAEADEFSMSIFDALGNTVRTINQDNISEIVYNPGAIPGGLRDDELVIWDGTSNNGNIVPSGTYYYVLDLSREQLGSAEETASQNKKYYIVVSD